MADRRPSLLVVAFATFDTVAFVLLLVLAGHATGALADLLGSLNTVVGVAIFCYLWALVVLGLQWALAPVSLDSTPTSTIAMRGIGGGGLIGGGFLLGLLLVTVLPLALTGNLALYSLVLVALIGVAFAIGVGAAIGLLFSLFDLALYRLAGRSLPAAATEPDRL